MKYRPHFTHRPCCGRPAATTGLDRVGGRPTGCSEPRSRDTLPVNPSPPVGVRSPSLPPPLRLSICRGGSPSPLPPQPTPPNAPHVHEFADRSPDPPCTRRADADRMPQDDSDVVWNVPFQGHPQGVGFTVSPEALCDNALDGLGPVGPAWDRGFGRGCVEQHGQMGDSRRPNRLDIRA